MRTASDGPGRGKTGELSHQIEPVNQNIPHLIRDNGGAVVFKTCRTNCVHDFVHKMLIALQIKEYIKHHGHVCMTSHL